jgi:hypothetical protein
MQNKFVADGFRRFLHGKKTVSMKSIQKKYAKELAAASPAQKTQIRERMAEEYRRLSKNEDHKPSPGTLW